MIELPKQKILLNKSLLSNNEQVTNQKLYMGHDVLAGGLIHVSTILLSLFLCLSSSMKLGPDV